MLVVADSSALQAAFMHHTAAQCQHLARAHGYLLLVTLHRIRAWRLQTCVCLNGFRPARDAETGELYCKPYKETDWLTIMLPTAFGIATLTATAVAVLLWRKHVANDPLAVKQRGPPGEAACELGACVCSHQATDCMCLLRTCRAC